MEWEKKKLGDVLTLQRGFDLPSADRRGGAVPIISSSGLTGYHDVAKVDPPGVVTGRYGTLGQVFYIEQSFWPLNTALFVKDFKSNYPRFCAYLLQTLDFGSHNAAGAVPGINRNHLHGMEVDVPDLATQRRIAYVLSAYDDLIENNTKRIRVLEEMARGLYREWFVHFRYPGHERVPLVESPLGKVPKGWNHQKLSMVADVNRAQISSRNAPSEIQYIDIASVEVGQILATTRYVFGDAPGRARRVVQHGDTIWSCVRPNRRSHALMIRPQEDVIVSTGFAVLTPRHVPMTYLYHATTTDEFVSYLTNHAGGAAYPAVNSKIFEDSILLIPSQAVASRFGEMTEPMVELVDQLQRRNRALRAARDLLLPRLMSGRMDVSGIPDPGG